MAFGGEFTPKDNFGVDADFNPGYTAEDEAIDAGVDNELTWDKDYNDLLEDPNDYKRLKETVDERYGTG